MTNEHLNKLVAQTWRDFNRKTVRYLVQKFIRSVVGHPYQLYTTAQRLGLKDKAIEELFWWADRQHPTCGMAGVHGYMAMKWNRTLGAVFNAAGPELRERLTTIMYANVGAK